MIFDPNLIFTNVVYFYAWCVAGGLVMGLFWALLYYWSGR